MEGVLERLAEEYQELNGTYVERVRGTSSSLEFSRLLRVGRPVLLEGFLSFRPNDSDRWTDSWLLTKLGSRPISIAVTPDGNADALVSAPDGTVYFVEPLTEKQDMSSFLSSLQSQTMSNKVRYLQSQNGNIFNDLTDNSDFEALREHVPRDVEVACEALGTSADAVNLWIGDHRSVTSLHSDPYENIYHVIRGIKYFTLFPPTENCFFEEQLYPHASYTRDASGKLQLTPSDPSAHRPVRWFSFDPARPPRGTMPIHVQVRAGQTLYLPAGWNHYVRQGGPKGGDGICVALNWWYDVEMRGMQLVWMSFLRKGRRYLEHDSEEDGEEAQAEAHVDEQEADARLSSSSKSRDP